jgi:hypothetical protein
MSSAPGTGTGNHYFRVNAPFEILVKIGLRPAQAFIGSSQILQTLYEPVMTRAGDEIHALVGGDFLVRTSNNEASVDAYFFDTRHFDAGELMLHPAPPMPKLPADRLVEIGRDSATRVINYRANEPKLGSRIKVAA